jgi:3-oxoadipate enol-lactonase
MVRVPLIKLDETEIYYESQGRGDPLLLIHGLGSSSRDWELQVPDFSCRFQVMTVDLRGHGRSGKPPGPYSMSLFAKDTARLLEELHTGSVHVLGISLGGMVGLQLALDYPQMTRSLIVVNSVPELVPRSPAECLGIWQRLLILRFSGMRKMGQVLADRFFPSEDQAQIREIFISRWAENDKPAYLSAFKAVIGWSVKERLGQVSCPVLILGGDRDYFPTSEKVSYSKLIPGAKLEIIDQAGHALPAEKPVEFNRAVLDFLADLA